jgi:hypothetical protein
MSSILRSYPDVWEKLWREIGAKAATPIGRMSRNEAIKALRHDVVPVWTLQQIGDLFGMTRERVRQIAGTSKRGSKSSKRIVTEEEINRVLLKACHDSNAWTKGGKLSRMWLKKQLPGGDTAVFGAKKDARYSKFQVLMVYGLGLITRQQQLDQLSEWQFGLAYQTYATMAENLSSHFVRISHMAVHRGAVAIGFAGHLTSAPGQSRTDPRVKSQEE